MAVSFPAAAAATCRDGGRGRDPLALLAASAAEVFRERNGCRSWNGPAHVQLSLRGCRRQKTGTVHRRLLSRQHSSVSQASIRCASQAKPRPSAKPERATRPGAAPSWRVGVWCGVGLLGVFRIAWLTSTTAVGRHVVGAFNPRDEGVTRNCLRETENMRPSRNDGRKAHHSGELQVTRLGSRAQRQISGEGIRRSGGLTCLRCASQSGALFAITMTPASVHR